MIPALDQFNFHHTLEETSGAALVVFTAPLCGACDMLRSAMEHYGSRHPDTLMFEVDAQQDMALTSEFDVFDLPALFLYLDGRYHDEIRCEALPEKIAQAVEEACLGPAAEAP